MKTVITLGYRHFFAELSGQEVEHISRIFEKLIPFEDHYGSNVGTVNVRRDEDDMEKSISINPKFKLISQDEYEVLKAEAQTIKEVNT